MKKVTFLLCLTAIAVAFILSMVAETNRVNDITEQYMDSIFYSGCLYGSDYNKEKCK